MPLLAWAYMGTYVFFDGFAAQDTNIKAAYTIGDDAALKLMLAQDRVADAGRLLVYHRYLQQQRSERIATLQAEMVELDGIEARIQDRRAALEAAQTEQRAQLAQVEADRHAMAFEGWRLAAEDAGADRLDPATAPEAPDRAARITADPKPWRRRALSATTFR